MIAKSTAGKKNHLCEISTLPVKSKKAKKVMKFLFYTEANQRC